MPGDPNPTAEGPVRAARPVVGVSGGRAPGRPVGARLGVLGLWPDAGFRGFVEIDRPVLEGTVERVVATAAGLVQARTTRPGPGGADVDAAAPPSSLAAA